MIPLDTPVGTRIVAIATTEGPEPNVRAGETYTLAEWTMARHPRTREMAPALLVRECAHVLRRERVGWFRWAWRRWVFAPQVFRLPVTLESLVEAGARAPEGPLRGGKT